MRKWTDEQLDFLMKNKELNSTDLTERLNVKFGTTYTRGAVVDKRSEIHAVKKSRIKKGLPLYSEIEKKGYIWIKVQEYPCKWLPKQKYVWLKEHPGEKVENNDVFIFLDMNNRNFNPANIIKINRKDLMTLNMHNPLGENVEKNKVLISIAKLRRITLEKNDIGKS